MATFSFLPSPVPGHVNPTLAVAKELVDRGHAVTYHVPEAYQAQVDQTGARLRAIRLEGREHYQRHPQPSARFAMFPAWLAAEAAHVLPQVLSQVGEHRPDVIVYDMTCVWGRFLSKILPGPAAMIVGSYVSNEHFSLMRNVHYQALSGHFKSAFTRIAPVIDRLNRTYGTQERAERLFARDERLVLVIMPRAFHPAGETFAGPFVFVGSCIRPEGETGEPAPGALADGRRPTVYVSFSTLLGLTSTMVETVSAAFADEAWQVILSLGDCEPAGRLPPNIIARRSLPQLEVLRAADAFVTHGGTNSVVEAIAHRVPMVAVPSAPEHAVTADRVAELGLGVRFAPSELTADALRSAVEEVSASREIRLNLRRMRDAQAADGGPVAAADALEGLLPSGGLGPVGDSKGSMTS